MFILVENRREYFVIAFDILVYFGVFTYKMCTFVEKKHCETCISTNADWQFRRYNLTSD